MRLGITCPSFVEDPTEALAVAGAAEAAGVDGVFVYDHLFRRTAHGAWRPALEGVALLGAVAAATTTIAVGSLVFRAWLRPPASLRAAVETVSRVAPGRVIAALGAGDADSREENERFGLGFGTVDDRVARLVETVRAVRGTDATVWIGGHSDAVRAVAAAEADGWNAWGGDAARFAAQADALRAEAARDAFGCNWGGLVVVDADDETAIAKAQRLGASSETIVGGPAAVARALAAYRDAGATWAILAPVDSRDPANATLLGTEVRAELDRV